MVSRIPEVLHVFRFALSFNDRELHASSLRWEGPHLVLSRRMVPDPDGGALIEQVKRVGGDIRVKLWTREALERSGQTPTFTWKLKFEKVMNRGFVFLDAKEDELATEAVCFVNAEMILVR